MMYELKEIREALEVYKGVRDAPENESIFEEQTRIMKALSALVRLEIEANQSNKIECRRYGFVDCEPRFCDGAHDGEFCRFVPSSEAKQREGAPEGPLPKLMEFVYEPADMAAIREIQEAIWIIDKFPGSIELTQALDLLKAAKVNIASICADERKKAADRYCAFCESHGDCRSYVRCSDRLAILGER
jgi:uncharacterized protein YlxP (DUF503 family)